MASLADAGMALPGMPGLRELAAPHLARAEVGFPYRPAGVPARNSRITSFTAALDRARGSSETLEGVLGGPAAFLADVAFGTVTLEALAAIIGRFALATGLAAEGASVTLSAGGLHTTRQALWRDLAVEETGFGAARVLYEEPAIGLYILEIAPGRSIPAHCHHVMREWELILDDGLLQQGNQVPRGSAFAWPLGQVHAYRNPTARPLRILCIDSPRFDPADERPLEPAPPLVPLAPFAKYPV